MPRVQRLRTDHFLLPRVKGVSCVDRPNPFKTKDAPCDPLGVPVGASLVETVLSNPAQQNSYRVISSPNYRTENITASHPQTDAASYRDPIVTDADFQQIYIKKLEQELANCKAQLNERSRTHRAINSSAAPGVTSLPYASNPSTSVISEFGLPNWVPDPRRAKVRVQRSLSTSKYTDWSAEETCSGLKRKCSDLRCRKCIKIDRHVEKGNKHNSKGKMSHSGSQRLSNDRGNDLQCNCQSDFSKCSRGADTRLGKVRPKERDKSPHRPIDHTRQNHSSVKHQFQTQGHKKDKPSKSKHSTYCKNIYVEMIGQKRGFADSDEFVHRKSAIQNTVVETLFPSRIAEAMEHVPVYKPIQDDLNSPYMRQSENRRNSAIEGEANSTLRRRLQNLKYAEDTDSVILDDQASYKTVVPSPIGLSHKRKSSCCV